MTTFFKVIAVSTSLLFLPQKEKIKKEIIGINKAYYSTTTHCVELNMNVNELSTGKPVRNSKMNITKAPGYYHVQSGNMESFANMKYKININHKHKTMIVTRIKEKAPYDKHPDVSAFDQKNIALGLDTILDLYKDVSIDEKSGNTNEISFIFKTGSIIRSNVIYDKTNYRILQLETYTTNGTKEFKQVVKYDYKNISSAKKTFDESTFFTLKKGKIVLSPKYSKYKLVSDK